ncbi:MAG: FAD-binding protein, partial [Myxococcota bacterium]
MIPGSKALRRELEIELEGQAEFEAPLARLTSLRVGGPADVLVRPANRADLVRVFELATRFEVPICVLGGGFNTLVRDEGIRGIVVHLGALRKVHRDGHGHVTAEAGATHSTVTRFCEEHGLSGLEFAVGI